LINVISPDFKATGQKLLRQGHAERLRVGDGPARAPPDDLRPVGAAHHSPQEDGVPVGAPIRGDRHLAAPLEPLQEPPLRADGYAGVPVVKE